MPDKFTQTTTTGYGTRLMNSLKGIIFGIIIFFVSIGLLYWNEGRVDLSTIAKTATEINSSALNTDPALSGKLVSTSGVIKSEELVGDNLFLKPDKFIAVERRVEMYSWVEKSESKSTTNTGGSQTTETTYTYTKEWKEHVMDSSNFNQSADHLNPSKGLESLTTKAMESTVGVYKFNPQSATLPSFSQITLNPQNVTLSTGVTAANDSYLFIKKTELGTFENPQIGDMRISYYALKPGFNGTVFGKLNDSKIDPYFDEEGTRLYRLFNSTRDESIATLHTEYTTMLWILRIVGFLLMWFGISALFEPISVLLDFLPIFGTLSRTITSLITFVVASVLSLVIIFISMIFHNIVALIVAVVITLVVVTFLITRFKKSKA